MAWYPINWLPTLGDPEEDLNMPDNDATFKTLDALLKKFSCTIANDLTRCEDQKILTTKHERRERALAYLLESLTGVLGKFPSVEWTENLLETIGRLKRNIRSQEAQVGLERAEKRLRWALDHPKEGLSGIALCVACGEPIPWGASCNCDGKAAKAKDIAMARDDTVE